MNEANNQHKSRDKQLRPDIPHELMEQQNALELRLQEREDAFWGRFFEVALLVITIVPTLVTGREQSRDVLLWVKGALIFGGVGIVSMFYVLRRSSRQLKELLDYGKRICAGEKICMEFHPRHKTMIEHLCTILASLSLGLSLACIFASIIKMGA